MAILRVLNEFAREPVVLALEPARQCAAHCSYCFSALNSKIQEKGKVKDFNDTSTFEFAITKSFGSSYNPEDFLQWSIRNRLPLGFANTVEPFQDINQSIGILKTCDKFSIPLFIQTKGLNFFEVFPVLAPFHDNSVLFVSFPTDDDLVLRRFEPGTPGSLNRLRVISEAVKAGFYVILALSPYHEDWIDDPVRFLKICHDAGISQVFFDRLHLNIRQRKVAKDRVMVDLATKSEHTEWTQKCLDHYRAIYEFCLDNEIPIFANDPVPLHFGMPNTISSISPYGVYERGQHWNYNDGTLLFNLESVFDDDIFWESYDPEQYDGEDSILVTWKDVLESMESNWKCDQPFSWSSLSDLMIVKTIPKTWQGHLRPRAPIQEYLRAMFNNPNKKQFVWHHPFTKVAMKPDGSPWTDSDGNITMTFDPYYDLTGPKTRVVDTLENFRTLDKFENVGD